MKAIIKLDFRHNFFKDGFHGGCPLQPVYLRAEALGYLQHLGAIIADGIMCLLTFVNHRDQLFSCVVVCGMNGKLYGCYIGFLESSSSS